MKNIIIFTNFLFFLILTSCSQLSTSTSVGDCFVNIPFTLGETEMNEVISVWGEPTEKRISTEEFNDWYYDHIDMPNTSIMFKEEILDSAMFFLKKCTFGDVVAELGQPEKVEITIIINDVDLSKVFYSQTLHYSTLGYYFSNSCNEVDDCFTFRANDTVGSKVFYLPGKKIEDYTGFNMTGYVYNWHGFNINVEETEDKIKD